MTVLLVDNYDSFSYNLARYVDVLGYSVVVKQHDISIEEMIHFNPSHLILSPGPGAPDSAGVCIEAVRYFASRIPILGVCLGHQAIAVAYGGKIRPAKEPMHGRAAPCLHQQAGIFHGLPMPLSVGRYHSLIVDEESLPQELCITAYSEQGDIMAIAHNEYPIYGVQFHPESILTDKGAELLATFLTNTAKP